MERWAKVPGWPEYEASTEGRIRRESRVLTCSVNKKGYRTVSFSRSSAVTCRNLHSVILETFVGPRPEGKECCHNNGVRADCRLANLRYDTRSGNARDRRAHGTARFPFDTRGERNCNARLTESDVRAIRSRKRAPIAMLAREFGVHPSTMYLVVSGKTWGHV